MKHHTLAAAVVLALAIARPAVADTGWHIWQSGTVGCELRSDVEQILNLPTTDDLMSGRCFLLASNLHIELFDSPDDIDARRAVAHAILARSPDIIFTDSSAALSAPPTCQFRCRPSLNS